MFEVQQTEGEVFRDDKHELRVARVRLQLARAWHSLTALAFDALLTHGINYRTLPSFNDPTLLDEAEGLNILSGTEKYMEWMRRVEHDIKAAVRRKAMRAIT